MRGPLRCAALASLLASAAGCSFGVEDITSVPEHPTWENDVAPLLANHCTLCHGERASRGAPSYFRLDRFDDAGGRLGAGSMAAAALRQVEADRMPPAAAWGDGMGSKGKELLRRWVEQGAPAR